MILSAPLPWRDDEWKVILRKAIRDADSLREALQLKSEEVNWIDDTHFPVLVPQPYLSRIERGNPSDPLLLQVAPSVQEQVSLGDYTRDPLNEQDCEIEPGTLQKYRGRVLHIATSACPIHCRYCFRRHYPYHNARNGALNSLLDYIRTDESIVEVILSGGDPLTLADSAIKALISKIEGVHHVKILRIHSRFSVVIPQRITEGLLRLLRDTRLRTVLVTHINHPNEIDETVRIATHALRDSNVMLLNQSVLLKNVNDSSSVLARLSQKLFDIGVSPYYLHMLDKVEGSAHFDTPEVEARELHRELQMELPGYLVPRLVREVPGSGGKTIIG
ncbi:MAG: EF-P beta-lysylation protein EpmB [Gammaproteobacteria bacterium]|nr:EF-P beta-lysylation protein EpmB [Gammaproteobacteria bacterium]